MQSDNQPIITMIGSGPDTQHASPSNASASQPARASWLSAPDSFSFLNRQAFLSDLRTLLDQRHHDQQPDHPEQQPSCFLSYAWEADPTDLANQQAFLKQLQHDLMKLGAQVFLEDTHMDGNIKSIRQGVYSSSHIFIIGTPCYRQRAVDKATNVAVEFDFIQERMKTAPADSNVQLVPILYSGDFGTSFPPGVMETLIRDLRDPLEYWQNLAVLSPVGLIPSLYGFRAGDHSGYESLLARYEKEMSIHASLISKVHHLRQQMIENEYISKELGCFIAPNGQHRPDQGEDEPLLPWVHNELLHPVSRTRVLLLLGQAGAGKSTFSRYLLRELWHQSAWATSQSPNDPLPQAYIPLFITLGSSAQDLHDLFSYLLYSDEVEEKFSAEEVALLKRHYHVLLICDGYDEMMDSSLNLYDLNGLEQYGGRVKLVIGCRTQHAQTVSHESCFLPHDEASGKPLSRLFKHRYVAPFTSSQISAYMVKYLAHHSDERGLWPDVDTYQKHLANMPQVRELISTPFILYMVMQVLPDIVTVKESSRITSTGGNANVHHAVVDLTRAKLYDYFLRVWFKREAERVLRDDPSLVEDDLISTYWEFCLDLATQLHKAKAVSVQYPSHRKPRGAIDIDGPEAPWVQAMFGSESDGVDVEVIRARKGSPLRHEPGNYYHFIHDSLKDFFVTTSYVQSISISLSPSTSLSRWRPTETSHSSPSDLLSESILTFDQWSFLADRVKGDEQFIKHLFHVIEQSKQDASEAAAIAASNAMSILNLANETLSCMGFNGVRCPHANLSGAVLDCVQFKGADLSHVNLQSAWLRGADFEGAHLEHAFFGEHASLQTGDRASSIAFSRDGLWLAVACGVNIEFYDWHTREFAHALKGRHSEWLTCVSFDPSGRLVASGSYDGSVILWDVESKQLLHQFKGHSGSVTSVNIDLSGKLLASGSRDASLILWDIESKQLLHQFKGHYGPVTNVCFDTSGKLLASSTESASMILLWDIEYKQLIHQFKGHSAAITSVSFDPSGKLLASGSHDKSVLLWDLESKQLQHQFKVHSHSVTSVIFDPSGKLLASGSWDNSVILWDVDSKQLVHHFKGHHDYITSVSFDPSGKILASCDCVGSVRLWDIECKPLLHPFKGHAKPVTAVSFDTSGKLLASSSDDNSVRLWDVESKQLLDQFLGQLNDLASVSFDPSGKLLASGSWDGVVLWDVESKQLVHQFMKPYSSVIFAFSGKLLASGTRDKSVIQLWDIETKRLLHQFKEHSNDVTSVSFDPSGKLLASGSRDASVILWNIESKQLLHQFKGHSSSVTCISFDPSGRRLASGSNDNSVRLWDVESKQLIHQFKGDSHWVSSVSFDPSGKLLAAGSWDGYVLLWDVESKQPLYQFQGHSRSVTGISFDPSGKLLASCSVNKSVRLWDVESMQLLNVFERCLAFDLSEKLLASISEDGSVILLSDLECSQPIHQFEGHSSPVTSVSFNPSDKLLASGSKDGSLILWDIESKQLLHQFKGHSKTVTRVSFDPSGKILISSGGDKSLILWNVESRQLIHQFKEHSGPVTSVSFDPSGKLLASGSRDKSSILWNVESKQFIYQFEGHSNGVTSVCFDLSGKLLASGSRDASVILWNIESKQLLHQFKGHSGSVTCVMFDLSGKLLASGSEDKNVILWDVDSKLLLRQLKGHSGSVKSISFDPSGKLLASGSEDKSLMVWEVESKTNAPPKLRLDLPHACNSLAWSSCSLLCVGFGAEAACFKIAPNSRGAISATLHALWTSAPALYALHANLQNAYLEPEKRLLLVQKGASTSIGSTTTTPQSLQHEFAPESGVGSGSVAEASSARITPSQLLLECIPASSPERSSSETPHNSDAVSGDLPTPAKTSQPSLERSPTEVTPVLDPRSDVLSAHITPSQLTFESTLANPSPEQSPTEFPPEPEPGSVTESPSALVTLRPTPDPHSHPQFASESVSTPLLNSHTQSQSVASHDPCPSPHKTGCCIIS